MLLHLKLQETLCDFTRQTLLVKSRQSVAIFADVHKITTICMASRSQTFVQLHLTTERWKASKGVKSQSFSSLRLFLLKF